MSRAVLVALLIVAIAYTNAFPQVPEASKECGPNEQFNACGSECIDTCTEAANRICTLKCVIGCQCKDGFVRNAKKNQCVLTQDC